MSHDSENKDKKGSNIEPWKKETILGLIITGLIVLTILISIIFAWSSFKELKPNEWGDFLAGSIGVLALTWLIIGYFLQSKELSQNTKALIAQEKELSKQTTEIKAQAKATRDMITFNENRYQDEKNEKLTKAKGIFVYDNSKEIDTTTMRYIIRNEGGEISNVHVLCENKDIRIMGGASFLNKKDIFEITLTIKDSNQIINSALQSDRYRLPIDIDICYIDCFYNTHKENHQIDLSWLLFRRNRIKK